MILRKPQGRQERQDSGISYPLHTLVSQYPPLTKEETLKNLEIIRKGRKAASLLKNEVELGPEQRSRLEEQQKEGAIAKEKIVLHFTQLVLGKAARRQSLAKASILDVNDLFQEGTIGLMNTPEKFDPEKGSFPCYATAAIIQGINRAIENQGELVRTPVHGHAKLTKIRKAQEVLQQDLKRSPSIEELSAATGITVKTILALLRNSQKPISLEKEVGDKERVLGDLIPDPKAISPEVIVLKKQERQEVRKALDCLNQREKTVICLRFGFITGEPLTLREVGRRLGFSAEWVRLTEAEAFKKLKEKLPIEA